ncbi:MAG: tripartite tricarboxylate transporter substrate binding protein [Comamonadaceae bacterium]|nr:MAG: tripartite tricarboxylate transporter substrate binding protein [Comamonadaceae bacterium]
MPFITSKFTGRRGLLLAAMALAFAAPALQAQPLFEKPIRIIVGGPAGGTADILARLVSEGLGKSLGQPVIVDNKPGAMGATAMDSFLSAPHNGNTYLLAVNGLVSEVPYSLKTKYDPFKGVKPLVEVAGSGLVLVGGAALPPKNMPEMVSYVKANPGKINFASYTPGTLSHVLGLHLNKVAGLDMLHIGYKGSPPALQDLMGGQVQFMFDGLPTSMPYIKAGKLRAFAVSSPERSPALPEVPTLAELGHKDLTKSAWLALWTVPDAPAAAQNRVREETLKVLAQPALRDHLMKLGLNVNTAKPPTPEEMSKTLAADYKSIGEILKSVNYKPE